MRRHRRNVPPRRHGRLSLGDRSGHYQGIHHSEVYRDGKVYVYTAWDDTAEEVGKEMAFEDWVASVRR